MNVSYSLRPLVRRRSPVVARECLRWASSEPAATTSNPASRWSASRPSRGASRYTVSKLTHHDLYAQEGIPDLVSQHGYHKGWLEYQEHMCRQLDRLTAGTPHEHLHVEDLVKQTAREPSTAALFNHASMAWNNHFFYRGITPATRQPHATVLSEIESSFSTLSALRSTFLTTAETMFGPGFVWLVRLRGDSTIKANPASARPSHMHPTLHILTTYLAGSPLPQAHYRRQPRDLNTANAAEPVEALRGGPQGAAPGANPPLGPPRELPERMTKVQNTVGMAGPYAPAPAVGGLDIFGGGGSSGSASSYAAAPLGGADITPLLCVNTWPQVWMHDYAVGEKRQFLEKWWEKINWDHVYAYMNTDGFVDGRGGR